MSISDALSLELDRIIDRSPALWESLGGQSLFITGGTGWFGRWLLESIAHANHKHKTGIRVTVLSRHPERFKKQVPHLAENPAIHFHCGDIKDFSYPEGKFSHIIHAAATTAQETFSGETPLAKFDTLVNGTRHLLDFAAQCGTRQFLMTSSGVAYGPPQNGESLSEDHDTAPATTNPTSALGQSKRAAEFLCTLFAENHGWNLTIARCFSFIGPFQPLDLHYAIGNFIRHAVHNEEIIIHGDGTPLRSYLYTGDLVSWLITLLQRQGHPEVVNVGSDFELSIKELAVLVRDIMGSSGPISILGEESHSVGNPFRSRYIPCITRAREKYGLDVWTPLMDSIRLTAKELHGRPHRT